MNPPEKAYVCKRNQQKEKCNCESLGQFAGYDVVWIVPPGIILMRPSGGTAVGGIRVLHGDARAMTVVVIAWTATFVTLSAAGCVTKRMCLSSEPSSSEMSRKEIGCPDKISPIEVMRLIEKVAPLPVGRGCRDYTRDEWRQLLATAECLQKSDPNVLEIAFADYITHFNTSFLPGEDRIAEWSKVFVLLRVMFVEPEQSPETTGGAYGGFLIMRRDKDGALQGRLIEWSTGGPVLQGCCVGYEGPPYAADEELQSFFKHCQKRPLTGVIRQLSTRRH